MSPSFGRPKGARGVALGVTLALLPLVLSACNDSLNVSVSSGPSGCSSGTSTRPVAASPITVQHELYVLPGDRIDVLNEDGSQLLRCIPLPQAQWVRGLAVSLADHAIFVTSSSGRASGSGQLLRMDLLTNQVVWRRNYPTSDDVCVTNDGKRLYMSGGDYNPSNLWYAIDADTGDVITRITGGQYAHDTICSLGQSQHFYMGALYDDHLRIGDTATNSVEKESASLTGGVRPYVINREETLAYVNTNGLDGFEVVDLRTGDRLYTVKPRDAAPIDLSDTNSHGIALSPDEKEVWVINKPADAVEVFDVSGLPAQAPRQVAEVKLHGSLQDNILVRHGIRLFEHSDENAKAGWISMSTEGRYVYVGEAGDVIDRASRRTVAVLPSLGDSRVYASIDFKDGTPVATSTRYSNGAADPSLLEAPAPAAHTGPKVTHPTAPAPHRPRKAAR